MPIYGSRDDHMARLTVCHVMSPDKAYCLTSTALTMEAVVAKKLSPMRKIKRSFSRIGRRSFRKNMIGRQENATSLVI